MSSQPSWILKECPICSKYSNKNSEIPFTRSKRRVASGTAPLYLRSFYCVADGTGGYSGSPTFPGAQTQPQAYQAHYAKLFNKGPEGCQLSLLPLATLT